MPDQITCFRLQGHEDRAVAYGVEFPDGECILLWNQDAWDEDKRLDEPHWSHYGSMEDLKKATKAEVVVAGPVTVA